MLENCKENSSTWMFVLYFYTIIIQHWFEK